MNFIFLVILTKFTLTKSDDDQKYIDLLPESEKQAFLDIVARRLFQEVKSQAGNQGQDARSREIREEELEEHGDFVKRILAEESRNLRRSKDGAEDKKGVTEMVKADEDTDSKSEEDGSGGHIDLTLRSGKRLKRSNVVEKSNENLKNDEIPVQVIYDNNDTTTEKALSDESADATDIQVKGLRRNANGLRRNMRSHTVLANYNPDESSENENERDNSDSKEATKSASYSKGVTEPIFNNERSVEEKSDEDVETTIAPLTTSSIVVTTEPTTKIITTTTQATTTTIKLKTEATKNITNNGTVTLKPKYLRAADTTDEEVQNVTGSSEIKPNNETVIEERTTTAATKTEITITSTDLPVISDKPIGRSSVIDKTGESNNLEADIKQSNESNLNLVTDTTIENESIADIVTDTTTVAPLLATVHADNTTVRAENNSISPNKSSSDIKTNATKEGKVFNDLVKALRSGLQFQIEEFEEDDSENVKPNPSMFNLQQVVTKKPYEVYEISADHPPFVKKSIKTIRTRKRRQKPLNKEEPYYVPVYNYDPELVYYNSYNRLGPNYGQDDEETEIRNDLIDENIDIPKYIERTENIVRPKHIDRTTKINGEKDSILRKFKFNKKPEKKKIFTNSRIAKPRTKIKMPLIIKSPKFTEIYFNPDDYLDMDYYFGRSMRKRKKKRNTRRKRGRVEKIRLFPDTSDDEHVTVAMKKGRARTHKSAVRQVLYSRHIFGHIPVLQTTTVSPINEELALQEGFLRSGDAVSDSDVDQKRYRNSVPDEEDDDIAMDYYFGFEKEGARTRFKKAKKKREGELPPVSSEAVQSPEPELEESEPTGSKTGTIKEITSIYPQDAFLHFDALLQSKVPVTRTIRDVEIQPYYNVLRDMIATSDEALVKYDWLGTTVDIQAALDKLMDMSEVLRDGETVHDSDLQLFKYFQYLFETSQASLDETKLLRERQEEDKEEDRNLLPKNKHRKKEYLKNKGLLHRVWLYKRGSPVQQNYMHNKKSLAAVQAFLVKFSAGVYDLHSALTSIASITTYKKQKWFKNLKELFLKDAAEKQILEVLLHLTATRLFGLLEETARDGLEESWPMYIEGHEEMVLRTRDEFLLILKVLDELRRLGK